MELQILSDGKFEVKGFINALDNLEYLKDEIKKHTKSKNLFLRIDDSFIIPSALIGYLIRLAELEQKVVTLEVPQTLYELLEDLNLEKEFNLKLLA